MRAAFDRMRTGVTDAGASRLGRARPDERDEVAPPDGPGAPGGPDGPDAGPDAGPDPEPGGEPVAEAVVADPGAGGTPGAEPEHAPGEEGGDEGGEDEADEGEGDQQGEQAGSWRRRRPVAVALGRGRPGWGLLGWGLAAALATVGVHVAAALHVGAATATLGEARLAVATAVARGSAVVADPLSLPERFAALQLALVQTLLPLDDVPVADAARWACLLLGAATALLVWPVLRGLGIGAPAAAVGVAAIGTVLPVVVLHAGVSAAAPAAFWTTLAAALAVRRRPRCAAVAAVLAVLTVPLVAAALCALAAYLLLDGTVRRFARLRVPLGAGFAPAAAAIAVAAAGAGPLAGVGGPQMAGPDVMLTYAAGVIVVALAFTVATWLRPVLAAAGLLLVVCLVPGPGQATAALLVAPVGAVVVGVLVEQLRGWLGGRLVAHAAVAVLLVVPVAQSAVFFAGSPVQAAPAAALLGWLETEPPAGTVIGADALDRAQLLAAGFPAARLRDPADPAVPGELQLVTDRPAAGPAAPGPLRCPDGATVAETVRGVGGAPAAVCRTDGAGPAVAGERAAGARLGASLADNPALHLAPAAAAELRAGAVDPRLMLVLAAMTTAHQVTVEDFPAVVLDTPEVPRRRALVSAVDGTAPAGSDLVRTWLAAQQPPFVPSLVLPLGSALLVGYPAPPPHGLLPE